MRSALLIIVLYSFSGFSLGQECFEKIMAQPVFTTEELEEYSPEIELIRENLQCFIGHDLDSVDIAILSEQQILFYVLMELNEDTPQMTYGLMHKAFVEYTREASYIENKESMYYMVQLFPRIASMETWEKDSQLMAKAKFVEQDITKARDAVERYADGTRTYRQVFEMLDDEYYADEYEKDIFIKQNSFDLAEKLQESNDEGMPVVLYFADYNDPNCVKLRDHIENDEEFMFYFYMDMIFVTIYCDDQTIIAQEYQYFSNALNRKVTTEGDQGLHMLKEKYGKEKRPYMVALNGYGEKFAELNYTGSNEEIWEFLNQIDAIFYDIEPVMEDE